MLLELDKEGSGTVELLLEESGLSEEERKILSWLCCELETRPKVILGAVKVMYRLQQKWHGSDG